MAKGRPQGSKNQKREQADTQLSRCTKCGSTNREAYTSKRELAHAGTENGRVYTHVVWRNTRCKDCGQARVDRTVENRQKKK